MNFWNWYGELMLLLYGFFMIFFVVVLIVGLIMLRLFFARNSLRIVSLKGKEWKPNKPNLLEKFFTLTAGVLFVGGSLLYFLFLLILANSRWPD